MKKQILSFLLAVCMVWSILPVTAFAAENYGITIGDTEITSNNAHDVFADGSVQYQPETATLTLTNATRNQVLTINNTQPQTRLVINGICTLNAITSTQDLTITGGTLNINGAMFESTSNDMITMMLNLMGITTANCSYAVIAKKITVNNCTMNLKTADLSGQKSGGIGIMQLGQDTMTVNNANLNITIGTCDGACGIVSAENITFDTVKSHIHFNNCAHPYGFICLGKFTMKDSELKITPENIQTIQNVGSMILDGFNQIGGGNTTPLPSNIPGVPPMNIPGGTNGNLSEDELSDIMALMQQGNKDSLPMVEQDIQKTNTDKKDVSGARFRKLFLKATAKKQTITLQWKRIKDADKYILYGAPCGEKMKKIKTIKKTTTKLTIKKLKKGKYYKYMLVACKGNQVIEKSKSVHCVTAGGKKGNPTGINVKGTLSVKKKKSKKIKAKLLYKKPVDTHIAKFRYESANKKIAKVDKNGKVTGVKKGTTTIYVYAQNGLYKKITVTVK